ncbi:secretory phospholipase A2 receptor-like isoform X1 [Cimex lectularius]|uniref:C-type lectin domain-containing protein n=1 Tax=Cimex lectularius TaxID=79782 RepID=A0A8I6SA49_CIMLE|nr:secretory phospholipase A2 receptor-like isoform X1 [Cimex lectularius]XP_014261843.1 secretory phospholipase A2 receptor-like isoform X1 [Cimex lectularius]XP_014261844.1 secretory phospholipase A2 receptor-like isoform X1 [Cimex lectularius]
MILVEEITITLFTLGLAMIVFPVEGQKAKVARVKVEGHGFTILSRSGKQCLALCNSQPACDSANFDLKTRKCRVFTRCSPTKFLEISQNHIHYTKRPLVPENGYVYHAESDSCLKLMNKVTDFAEADQNCRNQNGRLVSLTDPGINKEAAELLRKANAQYAWIGLMDNRKEGDPEHSDGRRVSETNYFPTRPQQARNDPKRNCWSLSDDGRWAEHSCRNRTQFSICQIMSY